VKDPESPKRREIRRWGIGLGSWNIAMGEKKDKGLAQRQTAPEQRFFWNNPPNVDQIRDNDTETLLKEKGDREKKTLIKISGKKAKKRAPGGRVCEAE